MTPKRLIKKDILQILRDSGVERPVYGKFLNKLVNYTYDWGLKSKDQSLEDSATWVKRPVFELSLESNVAP